MGLMISHFSPYPIDTGKLRVQGLGVQEKMRPVQFDRPRGWAHYLFVVFFDWTPCHTKGRRQVVAPGTLVCWRPGTAHALGDPERPWNHSWLSVSGTEVARALKETGFPLDSPRALHDLSFFDSALAELYAEVTRPAEGSDAMDVRIALGAVTNLIRRLARALRPPPNRPYVPAAVLELRRHIDGHFHEPLRLGELAGRAGLSVSQLCLLHKRHFGATVMAHVRLVRLQQAARLLRDSDLKVRAVSDRVGFPDHYHFSKAFRRQFGRPPGRFRKEAREGPGDQ